MKITASLFRQAGRLHAPKALWHSGFCPHSPDEIVDGDNPPDFAEVDEGRV